MIIAAALAFDAGRYAWCAVALALTLACREDATIVVIGFGIWLAVARGRWRLGAVIAVASVLLLAFDLKYVLPLFRGEPYPHLHRYAYLGSSLGRCCSTSWCVRGGGSSSPRPAASSSIFW